MKQSEGVCVCVEGGLGGGEGAACETHKLIAGKEDGNKSSRKANVENAVLVYV